MIGAAGTIADPMSAQQDVALAGRAGCQPR